MNSRQRKIFWSLHFELLKLIDRQTYYLVERDNENYYQASEDIFHTVESLQELLRPQEAFLHVTSYFD